MVGKELIKEIDKYYCCVVCKDTPSSICMTCYYEAIKKAKEEEKDYQRELFTIAFQILENKRSTDNNDYISIPTKEWFKFKKAINEYKSHTQPNVKEE